MELQAKGDKKASFDKVLQEIRQRDKRDETRAVAPLKCAPDAVRLDTSELTIEESAAAMEKIVKERLG